MSDEEIKNNEEDVLASPDAPSLVPSQFATGDISLEHILEAALMAAGEPLSVEQLCALFESNERPHGRDVRKCLQEMAAAKEGTALELKEVASGWRFQVREAFAPWVKRLFAEKPQRYSRALLETLAIIGYRQPVTRGEIEEIRGVAVSTNIMRTLQEREWIRVLGHKELPGRPAMYGTTREFLDYFNLKSLDELPSLAELQDLDKINVDLDLPHPDQKHADDGEEAVEAAKLELAEEAEAPEEPELDLDEGADLVVAESSDSVH
ncbi:MAG: SMC-Scp complex subunit ScpB [Gammaproteobacteria bacterium]|nr:SMC-Scp complex subunit ScpB [Gammaproteobacteria bacterium]